MFDRWDNKLVTVYGSERVASRHVPDGIFWNPTGTGLFATIATTAVSNK